MVPVIPLQDLIDLAQEKVMIYPTTALWVVAFLQLRGIAFRAIPAFVREWTRPGGPCQY